MVVPGLLQTRDYAEVTIRTANGAAIEDQIARWIELRMERQQMLDRDEPLHLEVVIDEAVVRRVVGGAAVMRAQLTHLIRLAERPDVEIRLLPFAVGAHPSPDGPFDLFRMAEPYPDAACMQTPAGAVYVEANMVTPLAAAYDRLRDAALSSGATSTFLADLVMRLE
jgi:hypothetical protein